MTKAQQVYDKVEALVASGEKKAEAFRQIADELHQPFNSIRGAYYTHTRSLGGTPSRAKASNGDPIEQATAVLQRAIEAIDAEVGIAKSAADDAKTSYEQLRDSAEQRKAVLQAKIDVLSVDA